MLVEKPLADTLSAGRAMVDRADADGLVLMADHTYCYTPAVLKIRELVAEGALGDILFVDSVRINLGLVQPDVDVFWDLAPHDLSILDFILPGGLQPLGVAAHGADPLGAGKSCIGYLTLPLAGGAIAHVHVNWLSPDQDPPDGDRRQPTAPWSGTTSTRSSGSASTTAASTWPSSRRRRPTGRRRRSPTGSATPGRRRCPSGRRSARMVAEFAASIREGRAPRTDGRAGLRVLSVLEAAGDEPGRKRPTGRPGTRRVLEGVSMSSIEGARVLVTGGAGHDRLDARRPAARGRRRRRSTCSTTWSAAAGPTSTTPWRRAASAWSRATSATATWSTT